MVPREKRSTSMRTYYCAADHHNIPCRSGPPSPPSCSVLWQHKRLPASRVRHRSHPISQSLSYHALPNRQDLPHLLLCEIRLLLCGIVISQYICEETRLKFSHHDLLKDVRVSGSASPQHADEQA